MVHSEIHLLPHFKRRTVCTFAGCLLVAATKAYGGKLNDWIHYERPADYEALVTEVRPKMRDGAELDCKMAVPAKNGVPIEGKFPGVINNVNPYAILERFFVNQIKHLAERGYQGLTCRVRGTADSDGEFTMHGKPSEWNDSYDLVEWLAAQPGSNGRIGQEGASYGAMTSLQAAIMQPPHLETVVPLVPPSDLYTDHIYMGGVAPRRLTSGNWALVTSILTFPSMSPWKVWDNWFANPNLDDYWKSAAPLYFVDKIQVPTLLAPGWRDDVLPDGRVILYREMLKQGKGELTWMFSGDWNHNLPTFSRNVVVAWFDYWLKDMKNAPLPPARVVSHELNGERKLYEHWPPANNVHARRRWLAERRTL